jgi:hypothetical protein
MSSPDYRIKEVLGVYRSKESINQDTIIKLELSNKTNLVKPDKNVFVLNAFEQFNLERNRSGCYRINGKLDLLTDNWIQSAYCYGGNPPNDYDWDPTPLDNGSPTYGGKKIGKNWILQITYPAEKNEIENIKTQKFVGGNEVIRQSKAYEGIQIESITPINVNGREDRILLRTVQRHGVKEANEAIYLKSKDTLDYFGFHRVIGFEVDNEDRGLILETQYDTIPNDSDDFLMIRVLDVSFNDFNFINTTQIFTMEPTDENGQTIGQIDYIKIISENHGLRVGDWIDLRVGGAGSINGIYQVKNTINKDEFLIFLLNPPLVGVTDVTNFDVKYRLVDGIPSEYYYRKFKVLTELNDYEVYRAGYAQNIFDYGYGNNSNLFHFNKDINLNNLTDNLDRPISRLYLTITRRSSYGGPNPTLGFAGWGSVSALLEENRTVLPTSNNTTYNLEMLSYWQNTDPLTTGTISKQTSGSTYFGDFVEYNSFTMVEKTLSKVINRFSVPRVNPNGSYDGGNGEGYYYEQHNEIVVREFSDVVETVDNKPNEIFPFWAQVNNNGTVSWRDLLDIGFFEGSVKGVDYPFVNGCNYLYNNYSIYIRRQRPVNRDDFRLITTRFVKPPQNNRGGVC